MWVDDGTDGRRSVRRSGATSMNSAAEQTPGPISSAARLGTQSRAVRRAFEWRSRRRLTGVGETDRVEVNWRISRDSSHTADSRRAGQSARTPHPSVRERNAPKGVGDSCPTDPDSANAGPKAIERNHVNSVFAGIGSLPQVEREATDEVPLYRVAQPTKSPEIFVLYTSTSLDLESDDATIFTLDDQIDFTAIMRPPMTEARYRVEPGGLLSQFTHGERLEQMSEFGTDGGIKRCELLRGEPQESGRYR